MPVGDNLLEPAECDTLSDHGRRHLSCTRSHLKDKLTDEDRKFYGKWAELLDWMREYASAHQGVMFEKEADFTDYIYRMSRPYDLPTTIMSASLSDSNGKPVLLLNASPRHAVFKEVTLHPFESHTYRTLRYFAPKDALAEGKRVFTKTMLSELADELFAAHAH